MGIEPLDQDLFTDPLQVPTEEPAAEEEGITDLSIDGQMAFIDFDEWWKAEWLGMPEFVQDDLAPWKTLGIQFHCQDDMREFAALVGQPLTPETRSIWYPIAEIGRYANKRYIDDEE